MKLIKIIDLFPKVSFKKCLLNTAYLKKIKSSLYSLDILSGVTSERCSSPRIYPTAHTSKVAEVASRWQRVEYLIGWGYEPHTSRTGSECLIPLVPSGRYYVFLHFRNTDTQGRNQGGLRGLNN